MQEIFNFLLQYWKPIVGLILVLVSFLLALVRKKPVSDLLSTLYEFSILAVELSEENCAGKDPTTKLMYAVSRVEEMLKMRYPDIDYQGYVRGLVIKIIESILKTPQATKYKKGGK